MSELFIGHFTFDHWIGRGGLFLQHDRQRGACGPREAAELSRRDCGKLRSYQHNDSLTQGQGRIQGGGRSPLKNLGK